MKTFCIDIDGTICSISTEDYSLAEPYKERIRQINELYDNGNEIIIFTARGSKTGIDHRKLTEQQLQSWGLKYHNLLFHKPFADYYIDDKSIDFFGWFKKGFD
tara:strand:- start:16703 stop:17011 length:309 start_codon:yes stop_codon:yes gene_type:complete